MIGLLSLFPCACCYACSSASLCMYARVLSLYIRPKKITGMDGRMIWFIRSCMYDRTTVLKDACRWTIYPTNKWPSSFMFFFSCLVVVVVSKRVQGTVCSRGCTQIFFFFRILGVYTYVYIWIVYVRLVYLDFYEDVGVGVCEGDVPQGLKRLPYLLGRSDVNPHGGTRQRRLDVHPTCNSSRAIRNPAHANMHVHRDALHRIDRTGDIYACMIWSMHACKQKKDHRQHVQCPHLCMHVTCHANCKPNQKGSMLGDDVHAPPRIHN